MAPLGELVAPGGGELRAAQALGIFGGKHLRHRAVAAIRAAGATASRSGARLRGCTASNPETPSTITSRASCSVSPTSAIGPSAASLPLASFRTHSAPARVLPAPRPPSRSQVVQSPSGGR